MIEAEQHGRHCFLIKLDVPDVIVISKVASGYSMKTTDALIACLNKGIAHHADILREIAAHEKRKRNDVGEEPDMHYNQH